jgi:hypothetical protein
VNNKNVNFFRYKFNIKFISIFVKSFLFSSQYPQGCAHIPPLIPVFKLTSTHRVFDTKENTGVFSVIHFVLSRIPQNVRSDTVFWGSAIARTRPSKTTITSVLRLHTHPNMDTPFLLPVRNHVPDFRSDMVFLDQPSLERARQKPPDKQEHYVRLYTQHKQFIYTTRFVIQYPRSRFLQKLWFSIITNIISEKHCILKTDVA